MSIKGFDGIHGEFQIGRELTFITISENGKKLKLTQHWYSCENPQLNQFHSLTLLQAFHLK